MKRLGSRWMTASVVMALALPACRDDGDDNDEEGAEQGDDDDDDDDDDADDDDDDDADDDDDDSAEDGAVYLTPAEHLVRASMALRGVRPHPGDLQSVVDDPERLEGIVDDYLDSANFGQTIRDLHNDSLLTLIDYLVFPAGFVPKPPIEDADPYVLNRSITEAPLRLAEHVVMNDRPYTEIVTADYTLANGLVAAVWGLDYDGDGESWEVTSWDDGRGQAGILSDSWLYQRHSSTLSNANRGRANAISRALLCYDFLSRDIEVDGSVDLADQDAVADAVISNPACASCHQGLDPLASFFKSMFPLFVPNDIDYPFVTYEENIFTEQLGVTMREPAYFGIGGEGLADLGQLIADDPRFAGCAAKRFYAYFNQVDVDDVPIEVMAELQDVFVGSNFDAKALTKAIILGDDFRISHFEEELDEEDYRAALAVKKTRPIQLAQFIKRSTGFEWRTNLGDPTLGTVDLLYDSFLGYQVLAGGIDSIFVTRPSHTYSATSSLVLRGLAREAAHHVVDEDFSKSNPDKRKLLGLVEEDTTSENAVREQLAELHAVLLSELVEPDSEEVDETYELFASVIEEGDDPTRAWKVTLTAMLQDVRIAYY